MVGEATKKYNVEVQDENGNIYHPHTNTDVVFDKDGKSLSSRNSDFADSLKKISSEMEAYANKNYIINGQGRINQRGQSRYNLLLATPIYTVDRFKAWININEGTAYIEPSDRGIKLVVTSLQTDSQVLIQQVIEDYEAIKNEAVTLSFDVYIENSGRLQATAVNGVGGNHTQEATIPNKTTHLFVTTPPTAPGGAYILFVIKEVGTYYITNIKLEIGNRATPFVPRALAEELTLCQRFYEKSYLLNDPPKTPIITGGRSGMAASFANSGGTTALPGSQFIVRKRVTPTVEIFGRNGNPGTIWITGDTGDIGSTFIASVISDTGFLYVWQAAPPVVLAANQMYHYHFTADAEL